MWEIRVSIEGADQVATASWNSLVTDWSVDTHKGGVQVTKLATGRANAGEP